MISQRDLLTFNQALLDLYAPGLDLDNYSQRGFHFLTSLVSSDYTVHGTRNLSPVDPKISFHVDRPLAGLEEVLEPFGQLAPKYPWFCAHPETHGGRPHYRSDFYTDRQYRNLDIHSEVFQRWDHDQFMTMCVHSQKDEATFFGFSRSRRDFLREEREILVLAQTHLGSARHLAGRLSAAKPWNVSPEIFNHCGFTPRESEVLYWLTEGKSNVEIATILRISLPTVKGYLTVIFNKTGTGNRLAATLHAVELARKHRRTKAESADVRLFFTAYLDPHPTKVG